MMERKQSTARAAALALAERAARMAQRERRITEELAGFLGARERCSAILDNAQRRCEAIMARARRRSAASQAQAEAHVVELVALIGDRQEVAEHTGLSLREIRRAMREAHEDTGTEDTGTVEADAMEAGSGQAPREGGTGQGESSAEEEAGQVPELSEEQTGAAPDATDDALLEPEQQGRAGTSTRPEAPVSDVTASENTWTGTADGSAVSAGEVPVDSLAGLDTWAGTSVGEHNVASSVLSPGPGTGRDPGPSSGLLADVAVDGSSGLTVDPVAGWQSSAGESWWSSPPDAAA